MASINIAPIGDYKFRITIEADMGCMADLGDAALEFAELVESMIGEDGESDFDIAFLRMVGDAIENFVHKTVEAPDVTPGK